MQSNPIARVVLSPRQPPLAGLWLRQMPFALVTLAVLALAWLA